MENLNENVTVEQAVAVEEPAVQTAYEPAVDMDPIKDEIAGLAGSAFGKGLAATIMANFPITCYISIFMGLAGLGKAKKAAALAEENGLRAGGKNTAGKVLSIVGLAYGAYMSLTYTAIFVIYFLMFLLMILSNL